MNKESIIISGIFLLSLALAVLLSLGAFKVTAAGTNSNGTVSISITAVTEINFTVDALNFGNGMVDSGKAQAELTSLGTGQVTNGTWTPNGGNLTLQNIGQTNVNLDIVSNMSAIQLVGGTSPVFQWNVTDAASNSCTGVINLTSGVVGGYSWGNVNTTGVGTRFCTSFNYVGGSDVLMMDFKIIVPNDFNTTGGNARITATGTSI